MGPYPTLNPLVAVPTILIVLPEHGRDKVLLVRIISELKHAGPSVVQRTRTGSGGIRLMLKKWKFIELNVKKKLDEMMAYGTR